VTFEQLSSCALIKADLAKNVRRRPKWLPGPVDEVGALCATPLFVCE
jgi:hypothetical protein